MVTDSSGEDTESAFTDCVASSGADRRTTSGLTRQVSVHKMLKRAGSRKSKRQLGRGSRSPPDTAPPAAKRAAAPRGTEPRGDRAAAAPAAVELSAAALASIQQLIRAEVASVMSAFHTRIDSLDRRVAILEADSMDKDEEIRRLSQKVERQERAMEDMQQRVKGIDANRRLSSLILSCEEFGDSSAGENIEEKIVQVLNRRFPQLQMTVSDIQAAHRLQGRFKVIVRFIKRRLRDDVYDSRFQLIGGAAGQRQRNMAPLYITESLTPGNRLLYMALLEAKKPENGQKISSVFTRRGQVMCRTERGGTY